MTISESYEKEFNAILELQIKKTVNQALGAPYVHMPLWFFHLPISNRQREVLGEVFSFQAGARGAEAPREYSLSLSAGARDIAMERSNFGKELRFLAEQGYLNRKDNGPRTSATYTVDVLFCYLAAKANGYEEPWEETQDDDR